MNEINKKKYEDCNFRKKRTEDDYNINKLGQDNKALYLCNENALLDNENMNSINFQNYNDKNKYPDYQSFLQIHPKENAEIPSIKYYNYIFNIGSPFT